MMGLVNEPANPNRSAIVEATRSPHMLWLIFALAVASMLPNLRHQYVGEEALYPLVAQEMAFSGNYPVTMMYGVPFGRPPFLAWLVLGLVQIIGWEHVLVAARLISLASTIGIALTLAWLVRRIVSSDALAALAALTFLSGDMLIYRGWQAYADPPFAFFTFAAMSCLWVALEENRSRLLVVAAAALIATFFAKALTGYVFYGVLGLTLLWRHPNRRLLLRPTSILLHLVALVAPFAWERAVSDRAVLDIMLAQATNQLGSDRVSSVGEYLLNVATLPLKTFWYLLPASAIALYAVWRARQRPGWSGLEPREREALTIAALTLGVNILPYWFATGRATRYLMPLYPWFALCITLFIAHMPAMRRALLIALIGTIGISFGFSLIGFPLYQEKVRGDYAQTARTILSAADGRTLFVTADGTIGLSVTAHINQLRRGQKPLTFPPADWRDGLVIAPAPDANVGTLEQEIPVGDRKLFLLCRGDACRKPG